MGRADMPRRAPGTVRAGAVPVAEGILTDYAGGTGIAPQSALAAAQARAGVQRSPAAPPVRPLPVVAAPPDTVPEPPPLDPPEAAVSDVGTGTSPVPLLATGGLDACGGAVAVPARVSVGDVVGVTTPSGAVWLPPWLDDEEEAFGRGVRSGCFAFVSVPLLGAAVLHGGLVRRCPVPTSLPCEPLWPQRVVSVESEPAFPAGVTVAGAVPSGAAPARLPGPALCSGATPFGEVTAGPEKSGTTCAARSARGPRAA